MTGRHTFLHRLTVKLTLMHLLLFGTASLIVFCLIYLSLASALRARTDKSLLDESREFEALYVSHGLKKIQEEFINEARSNGSGAWFYILLSPDRRVLASSDLNPWRGVNLNPEFIGHLHQGEALFKTRRRPHNEHKVRILYRTIKGGHILEIGRSLRDNDEILEDVGAIFGYGFLAMLTVGALLGWLSSRHAMRGVKRVTETAIRIDRGDLSRRVPTGREGQEIEELAQAFNGMLDRIQALVKDLEDVTNNIAHDLRSPLTRIRGMTERLLATSPESQEVTETAGIIIEECDRLLGMINTMLLIAHVDSGLSKLPKTTLDLRDLVRDLIDLFQPAAEDKNIAIQTTLPELPLEVEGDRSTLQQVIANLLDNAIKFSDRGDTVHVTLFQENTRAVIEVRDSGIGIDEKDLPHIFDRFYRGDKSRSEAGNGLGLSLALSLIKSHGGEIKVTSATGEGSTFRVILPRGLS